MYPLDAYLLKLAQWLPRPLRRCVTPGHTRAAASRWQLSLTVSAPRARLSDFFRLGSSL